MEDYLVWLSETVDQVTVPFPKLNESGWHALVRDMDGRFDPPGTLDEVESGESEAEKSTAPLGGAGSESNGGV